MKFSDIFNSIINKSKKVTEVELFRALANALMFYGGISSEFHGIKGMVEYKNPYSGKNVKCEISDLLLIFIKKNELRFTFMQNKYSKVYNCLKIKHASYRQYHLLSKRPVFKAITPKNLSGNILHSAILSSVGSYGDFYQINTLTGLSYNMNYFSAYYLIYERIIKNQKFVPNLDKNMGGPLVRTFLTGCPKHCIICKNGFYESVWSNNLDDFFNDCVNMRVGTPISCFDKNASNTYILQLIVNKLKNNDKYKDLCKIIKENSIIEEQYNSSNLNYVIFDCEKYDEENLQKKSYNFK